MGRRSILQIKVDTLREAAKIMDEYGIPVTVNVLNVVADAIEAGTRLPKGQ